MTNSSDIQNAYIDLFKQLRNYLWDFNTVEHIGDLEVSIYDRFQNLDKIKNCMRTLYIDIKSVIDSDEDLKNKWNNLDSLLNDTDTVYVKLKQV